MPLALLVPNDPTEPLPVPAVHVTVTPATGLSLASRTITASGVASAWPAVPT